ncbi:LacI family DNA-binding transcriptional regulator [Sandarakinorhabdus limnophila]|uniref:LacI family DNA-binding transcriptional regulator n=1 Tax=Sandarakinorhabdus limnophila TaxID=210512 RepID=UPI0037C99A4F
MTSYDVARLAGVSQSAVSRCFKPGASVAPAKRDRIMAVARELGYAPNAIAQSLITKRSGLVAVLISNLTNLYYPEVLAELSRRLDARGMRVLLFALQAESDVDAMLAEVWRYRVDGIIAAARLLPAQVAAIAERGLPLVLYNRISEGEPVASVCCDSVAGETLLIDRLVAAGHRHFGIVTGPADSYVSNERVGAATARLALHGLQPVVVVGQFDHASGHDGLEALLARTNGALDALVAANDLMAIGAIEAARARGLKVPGDLSVVGFDGVGPAGWDSFHVTTIRQPVQRMTEAAVSMLAERIEQPDLPPERRLYAGEFLPGHSARITA